MSETTTISVQNATKVRLFLERPEPYASPGYKICKHLKVQEYTKMAYQDQTLYSICSQHREGIISYLLATSSCNGKR